MDVMTLDESHREVLQELLDCARAMGPYREDVVVTGGLVPLLYRYHYPYRQPRQQPILTNDLDFTVPESLPLRGDKRLVDCLEQGGFIIVPSRSITPNTLPKHFFQRQEHGTQNLAPIHGEFLSPLKGSEVDRGRNPKSPREIQSGLNAEALRYLELLLWKPVSFRLDAIAELKADESDGLSVRLPGPGAYVVQKVLSSQSRGRTEKRDKDFAYIYDVATVTYGHWASIQAEIKSLRQANHAWKKWVEKATRILEETFLSAAAFGPNAVEVVYDGDVRAATVQRVMSRFLEQAW